MAFFFKNRYLIRKRALGDVVWIEPVIEQLSKKYKKLIVFTKFNSIFNNYPLRNVVFKNDLSLFHKINYRIHNFFKWNFLYINLDNSYETNPSKHILHAYQDKAKLPYTFKKPNLYFFGSKPLNFDTTNKYVVLHLETLSLQNHRNVYGINWDDVIAFLKKIGYRVIQIGVKPSLEGVDFQMTSIQEMIYIIKNSSLFIGIDSGPSHIASAFSIKSILFFGSINPWFRHFRSDFNGIIMQSFCEFQHCYHNSKRPNGPICRIVGNEGIPKCSLHSTDILLKNINKILLCD